MTDQGRETDRAARDDSTPLPMSVDGLGAALPAPGPATAETVLLAVAAAGGTWFPARHAADHDIPRDSLDEPLAELRLAGLVRVAEWVRGVGQGYALTPEGAVAAKDQAARDKLFTRPTAPAAPAPNENRARADEEPEAKPAGAGLDLTPPVLVPALLLANVLWFFVCAVYSIRRGLTPSRAMNECHYEVLQRFGAVSGEWLLAGEWWRLLTSCFVHIGALHLIGNLFALAMMGPLAELLWGRGRLLLIYLISGLAGSALAMALRPDSILAGASGAIWGVQMSLFVWLFTFRKHLPTDLANDWFRRLCVVFALNAGVSFLPQVSWEGHLGGGIAGVMVAVLLNVARFGDRARRALAGVALALLPVLFLSGLAMATDANGIPAWQHLRERVTAQAEARASADLRQKVRVAQTDFNKEVATRLDKLDPDDVRPVEAEAGLVLARAKRAPEGIAPLRAKVAALKVLAEEAERHATAPPIGFEPFDTHRDRARAFAAARAQSFALLLGLLEAPGPVPVPARAAWDAARREADQLWTDMKPK